MNKSLNNLNPELSIIIVSYNTKTELNACLTSVFQNIKQLNFEIIVIDNNSSDSSASMITRNFPDVILINNADNYGFAKAVNQGLKFAKGNYYLLLNPDTKVVNNAIEKLVDFAKNQQNLGAVGAKLLNPDGSIQPSCYNLPSVNNAILEYWFGKKGAYEKYVPKLQEPVKVEAVVGAVMLISRTAIEKIGPLDERYFMYFEDLEWCRNAGKMGFKIFWNPQSEVVHVHGASASQIGQKAQNLLIKSSKIYNGRVKYSIITLIIKLSRLFRN